MDGEGQYLELAIGDSGNSTSSSSDDTTRAAAVSLLLLLCTPIYVHLMVMDMVDGVIGGARAMRCLCGDCGGDDVAGDG